TFYATDDSLAVDSEVVEITVNEGGNQLPILDPIGAQITTENVNLNFVVSASDVESIPIITTSALPVGATFDGTTFNWIPDFLQSGVYSVTFYATDDSLAVDSEVVSITVNDGGNQLPILDPIGAQITTENVNLNFVVTASDIESTPIITTSTLPSGATFDGTTFDWTPDFLQSGIYSVTFYATDDSLAVDSEIVSITVDEGGNQLPILDPIGSQITAENINLNFVVTASDIESTPIITTSALPSGATFDGATFDWTPSSLQSGIYSVTFYATDDSLAVDSEVISITVTEGGNLPPVLATIGAQVTTENVNLNFTVSATDAESVPVVTTSTLPTGATFTPSAGGGTFDWTPDFLQSGIYSVTFYATDDSLAVDSEVVSITVNDGGNQLPILAAIGAQVTTENVNLNFVVSATDIESTPIITTSALPVGATFDGTTFDWTPDFLQSGIYSVTFYATDDSLAVDSEVVSITVNDGGNQLPILDPIGSRITVENVNLNFAVSASDIESIPVITTSTLPTGATFDGTNFDWTPSFLQSGIYSVTFYATDDSLAVDSEVVSITVAEGGNQLPLLAAIGAQITTENVNLNFAVSATDVESVPVITTSALPAGATFTPSAGGGTFDWTPDFLQSGVYSVTFYATDDSLAVDSEVVSITVNEAGNQLPVLDAIGAQVTFEDVNLNFVVTASDAESTPVISSSALPS
ncbi:hypothetical protein JYU03_00575, partial [bacterium AH-315-F03]|nr:hypothetical protein [bacterium AH-315-F03]